MIESSKQRIGSDSFGRDSRVEKRRSALESNVHKVCKAEGRVLGDLSSFTPSKGKKS